MCKFKSDTRDRIYKSYVSKCLQNISSNTAKSSGGSYIKKSYDEIIEKIDNQSVISNNKGHKVQTSEQVIAEVVAKCGIKLKINRKEDKNSESI